MCISGDYCQSQFPNLLKILNKPKIDSVIKNNIIIAIGDLLHRFPNIVEPYSRYLYQNLHDKDTRVRKTTLTVLTHLALNDMIKVKGDICDIAMLFQDEDPEIESLVKQFFSEVNRKDPRYLFSIIPEALTRFS
jgi:condensin complex subunit 1